jgi:putative DNA primase/helicase
MSPPWQAFAAKKPRSGAQGGAVMTDPLHAAKCFIMDRFTVQVPELLGAPAGYMSILQLHQGEYFQWNGQFYAVFSKELLKRDLYDYLSYCQTYAGNELVEYPLGAHAINDVLSALVAVILQPVPAPCWLPNPAQQVAGTIPCKNVVVDSVTAGAGPLDPRFFMTWGVDYAYDSKIGPPVEWLTFLGSLWGEEEEVVADDGSLVKAPQGEPGTRAGLLQETFGYYLSGDKTLQKILCMIGARRGGKGTIAKVLTALMGPRNVAGSSLQQIGENFGRQEMIDKPLWIVPDMRLSNKHSERSAMIVQTLLTISGDDLQTVPRKHIGAWHGRLPTNVVIVSNDPPFLRDASAAWVSRLLLLRFTESFLGREDPGLIDRLLAELPAIFNWALEGRQRLTKRGFFIQPLSGQSMLDNISRTSSPVQEFVEDWCEVSNYARVECPALYAAFRVFCRRKGIAPPPADNVFGVQLQAALPGMEKTRPWQPKGTPRPFYYKGVTIGDVMRNERLEFKKKWHQHFTDPISVEEGLMLPGNHPFYDVLRTFIGEQKLWDDLVEDHLMSIKGVDDAGYKLIEAGEHKLKRLWQVVYTKPAAGAGASSGAATVHPFPT